jgi:hypothetical protein
LSEFRDKWAGRKFQCLETGEVFVIPDSVYYRDLYQFGESFIDVGDGLYARFGGTVHELRS